MKTVWLTLWLRPICVRKSLGQWEQGMVAAVADMAVPFLSFLFSSVAAFLLVSQTFAPHLTTSLYFSLSSARYSWQLGVSVFEALFLASLGVLALWQFAIEPFLQEAVTFPANNITSPLKLWLHQNGEDAGKRSPS